MSTNNLYLNENAEAAVIGCLLLDNNRIDDITTILKPKYFAIGLYEYLYSTILEITTKGRKADVISVAHIAQQNNEYSQEVTIDSLKDLIGLAVVDSISDHAQIIRDLYIKRELTELLQVCSKKLIPDINPKDTLQEIEDTVFAFSETYYDGSAQLISLSEAGSQALDLAKEAKSRGGISGVSSTFVDLDKLLGGLHNSDLIVLAGRPSMGKTALATNIALKVARDIQNNKDAVLLFSLEMSGSQIASRILAQETQVNNTALLKGLIKDIEMDKLVGAVNSFKDIPLLIDETPFLTISELRSKARKIKRTRGLKLIVLDYLQLVQSTIRSDNRIAELAEITRSLKATAKDLNIPIIALSQLSRAVESREDKRPVLSDLRESGSIEQDSDVVMFIYREQYYLERAEPSVLIGKDDTPEMIQSKKESDEKWRAWNTKLENVKNLASIAIAKNRHGAIGNVSLRFNPEFTVFENLSNYTKTS